MNWLVTVTGSDRETLFYAGGPAAWSRRRRDAVPLDSGAARSVAVSHGGQMWPFDLPVFVGDRGPGDGSPLPIRAPAADRHARRPPSEDLPPTPAVGASDADPGAAIGPGRHR